MTRGKQSVIILIALAVAALALLLTFMGDSPLNTRHTVATVPSPGEGDNALQANVTSGRARGGLGSTDAEVRVTGKWRGAAVDELVMRSQDAQPDMLRVGWAAPDSLVISVPQTPADAGRPLGAGDASYRCGNPESAIRVRCEAYPLIPVQERHYEPPPPMRSPNH